MSRRVPIVHPFSLGLLLLPACAELSPESDGSALLDHEEASDFDPIESGKADGLSFDRNRIMSDVFFEDDETIDAPLVQEFLEHTPYDKRCWLADERIDGRLASEVIVDIARSRGINPLLLVARMQVESSTISKSVRPSQSSIDHALGCGCPDGGGCFSSTSGLERQLVCAADVLRDKFDASADGTGQWRVGRTRNSLDGRSISPHNHATAAHYAYTPWVLPGSGGNWLVWNVLAKFRVGMEDLGVEIREPGFIATVCDPDDPTSVVCSFTAGTEQGLCAPMGLGAGYCSIPCEGLCPDAGDVQTFCVELDEDGGGRCLAKATAANDQCDALPGTRAESRSRFRGSSGANAATAMVCVPR